jgi:hypothetical protein
MAPTSQPAVVFYLARVGSATVYDIGDAAGQAYPGGTRSPVVPIRHIRRGRHAVLLGPEHRRHRHCDNFPDALSGAGATAVAGGQILLSDPLLLPLGVAEYLNTWPSSIIQALLFGGEPSLSPAITTTVSSEISGGA